MKKIGLVGGTGPESTLMYYRELNSRVDKLTNGTEMPDITRFYQAAFRHFEERKVLSIFTNTKGNKIK